MNTDTLLKYFDENGLGSDNCISYNNVGQRISLPNNEPCKLTYPDLLKLLKIYYIFSKREDELFEFIYSFHGCDSWEDIFRDYNKQHIEDKADGIEIGIKELELYIESIEDSNHIASEKQEQDITIDTLLKYFDENGLGSDNCISYNNFGQRISLPNNEQCKLTYPDLLKLLKIYYIFSKREDELFGLIYSFHGCDSWEDIFRDYNKRLIEDKADGVEIGIKELELYIESVEESKIIAS